MVAAWARRDPNSPLVFHRNGIAIRRWRTACRLSGATQRCLKPGCSKRIGNSRRTGGTGAGGRGSRLTDHRHGGASASPAGRGHRGSRPPTHRPRRETDPGGRARERGPRRAGPVADGAATAKETPASPLRSVCSSASHRPLISRNRGPPTGVSTPDGPGAPPVRRPACRRPASCTTAAAPPPAELAGRGLHRYLPILLALVHHRVAHGGEDRPQLAGIVGKGFLHVPLVEFDLAEWMATVADVRVHGTTHERPIDRFARERDALIPPSRAPHRLSASCGAPPRKRAPGGPAGETGLDTRQPAGLVARRTRVPVRRGSVVVWVPPGVPGSRPRRRLVARGRSL